MGVGGPGVGMVVSFMAVMVAVGGKEGGGGGWEGGGNCLLALMSGVVVEVEVGVDGEGEGMRCELGR